MERTIWKGTISFGLVQIPVGLYSAETTHDLHFSLLDRNDLSPIRYERVNRQSGKPVTWNNIVKGYEVESGKYVVMSAEDFRAANVTATQTIDIVEFVDASSIDLMFFNKPYYVAPQKKQQKAYVLLRETLKRTGKIGIAKVVLHSRQHMAALVSRGPALVLMLLRFGHEIRSMDELDLPGHSLKEAGITPTELEMAERLVTSMAGTWEPAKYRDEYHDDLLALIERKKEAGGIDVHATPAPKKRKTAQVIDIMHLLQESVARGGNKGAPGKKLARRKHAGERNQG